MEAGETEKIRIFEKNIWCLLWSLSSSLWGKYLKFQQMEEYSVHLLDFILKTPHPLAPEEDFGNSVQMEPFT